MSDYPHAEMTVEWLRIELSDPDLLSGKSIVHFVQRVSNLIPVGAVAILGAPWLAPAMQIPIPVDTPIIITTLDVLCERLVEITQVDWADFVFYASVNTVPKDIASRDFCAALEYASFCLSAVDNTYFILYTRNPEIIPILSTLYGNVDVARGAIHQLKHDF